MNRRDDGTFMELIRQTEELKQYLDELKVRYEANNPPETVSDRTFFVEMKAATEPIYSLLEEWETVALDVVKNQKINVHPHQIASTRENMELLILHSYYIDARRKRYMELNHSSHFIFDQLHRALTNESSFF